MSKDIDELVRWRDKCEALAASLQRKVRHCDEITEERDKALRERDEARAKIAGLPAWQKGCEQALADLADAEEAIARLYAERDEALSRIEDLEADVRYYEDRWERIIGGAYIRGAEAMREACAIRGGDKAYERMTKFRPLASEMKQAVRDAIRTLPIPEEP